MFQDIKELLSTIWRKQIDKTDRQSVVLNFGLSGFIWPLINSFKQKFQKVAKI